MSNWILIAAPLLVLAVVLLLGFAGCTFEHGYLPPSDPTLTLRATVPTALVLPTGVKFTWRRPAETTEESVTVTSIASGPSVEKYVVHALNLQPSVFWTLGNMNGLADRSPHDRNGTPLGGVTVGGEQDGPTDYFDARATQFDGVDDRITSAYNPFVGPSGRTFVGWTRRDTDATADLLFGSSAAATTDQARLFLPPATQDVRFAPNGSDGQIIVWANAWPGNAEWVWWALRFDQGADEVGLFIDGQLVSVQACTETWPAAPGNFQVGAAGTTSLPLGGDSALIAGYEKLLSDAELAALYQASQGGGNDVYEHSLTSPLPGSWSARCEMAVEGQPQPVNSNNVDFLLQATSKDYVVLFNATEGPPIMLTGELLP